MVSLYSNMVRDLNIEIIFEYQVRFKYRNRIRISSEIRISNKRFLVAQQFYRKLLLFFKNNSRLLANPK